MFRGPEAVRYHDNKQNRVVIVVVITWIDALDKRNEENERNSRTNAEDTNAQKMMDFHCGF